MTEGYQPRGDDSAPKHPSSGGSSVRHAQPVVFLHHTVFAIQSDQPLSQGQIAHIREQWRAAWLESGATQAPGLLLLEPPFHLHQMDGLTQA